MKKNLTLSFLYIVLAGKFAIAQAPQGTNYQAVLRDVSGTLMPNTNVCVQSTITNSLGSVIYYQETFNVTTNQFGLFTLPIGMGIPVTGVFANLNWGGITPYQKIEVKINCTGSYVTMGSSPLLSVPYALNAAVSATTSSVSGTTNYVPKFTPNGSALGNSRIYDNGTNVGIGTTSPGSLLELSAAQPDIRLNWTNSSVFSRILFYQSGTIFGTVQQNGSTYNAGRQNAIEIQNLTATGPISLWTNGTERMRIVANGYTGIGTTVPIGQLHVSTTDSVSAGYFSSNSNLYANTTASHHGVLTAKYTGSQNQVIAAIAGENLNSASSLPIGGYFNSYGTSVYAIIYSPPNSGSYTGVYSAVTASGTSTCWGINGDAYGSGNTNYGVYGHAQYATTNYAGYFAGNVYATGTITSSDMKLKQDIQPLTDGLGIIMALKPSTYSFRNEKEFGRMGLPEGKQYGLIAQEVEEVLPSIVSDNLQPEEFDRGTGKKIADAVHFKGLNYTELIPVLISGMQEQQKMIEQQDRTIAELKNELGMLKKK